MRTRVAAVTGSIAVLAGAATIVTWAEEVEDFSLKCEAPATKNLISISNFRKIDVNGTQVPLYETTKEDKKLKPKLVILGTGWAATSILKTIDKDLYDVVVVSPSNYFLFTPLLPEAATGTVEARSLMSSIRQILKRVDGEFLESTAEDIDFERKHVYARARCGFKIAVPYDKLIIAIGAQNNTFGVPGVLENAKFLKDINDARSIRYRVMNLFEEAALPYSEAERRKLLSFVVAGGGPTGVEFAAELSDLLTEDIRQYFPELEKLATITLINSGDHILNTFAEAISSLAEKQFQRQNVQILSNARVVSVAEDHVSYKLKSEKGGQTHDLPFSLCVWSTGIEMRPFAKLVHAKLQQKSGDGAAANAPNARALITDGLLRLKGVDDVFALGDCATMERPVILAMINERLKAIGADKMDLSMFRDFANKTIQRYPQTDVLFGKADAVFEEYDVDKSGYLDMNEIQAMVKGESVYCVTGLNNALYAIAVASKLTALPATAQVASQEGRFVGKLLNKLGRVPIGEWSEAESVAAPFAYKHLGSFSYIGHDQAVADIGGVNAGGWMVFWLWRGAFLSEQVSFRTRVLLAIDWAKCKVFGRDISRSYLQRRKDHESIEWLRLRGVSARTLKLVASHYPRPNLNVRPPLKATHSMSLHTGSPLAPSTIPGPSMFEKLVSTPTKKIVEAARIAMSAIPTTKRKRKVEDSHLPLPTPLKRWRDHVPDGGSADRVNVVPIKRERDLAADRAGAGDAGVDLEQGSPVNVFLRLRQADPSLSRVTDGRVAFKRHAVRPLSRDGVVITEDHYDFAHVFTEDASQEEVFERVAVPVLDRLFDMETDELLIAYGPSGSGKTFSVTGIVEEAIKAVILTVGDRHVTNITPSGWNEVKVDARTEPVLGKCGAHYALFISCTEIYNDKVKDLASGDELKARQDGMKNHYLQNQREVQVTSLASASLFLDKARKNRSTASTAANDKSSRSHVLTTIKLLTLEVSEPGLVKHLGSCIEATARRHRNKSAAPQEPIPYRECQLTYVLQTFFKKGRVTFLVHVDPKRREQTKRALDESTRMCAVKTGQDVKRQRKVELDIGILDCGTETTANLLGASQLSEKQRLRFEDIFAELTSANEELEEVLHAERIYWAERCGHLEAEIVKNMDQYEEYNKKLRDKARAEADNAILQKENIYENVMTEMQTKLDHKDAQMKQMRDDLGQKETENIALRQRLAELSGSETEEDITIAKLVARVAAQDAEALKKQRSLTEPSDSGTLNEAEIETLRSRLVETNATFQGLSECVAGKDAEMARLAGRAAVLMEGHDGLQLQMVDLVALKSQGQTSDKGQQTDAIFMISRAAETDGLDINRNLSSVEAEVQTSTVETWVLISTTTQTEVDTVPSLSESGVQTDGVLRKEGDSASAGLPEPVVRRSKRIQAVEEEGEYSDTASQETKPPRNIRKKKSSKEVNEKAPKPPSTRRKKASGSSSRPLQEVNEVLAEDNDGEDFFLQMPTKQNPDGEVKKKRKLSKKANVQPLNTPAGKPAQRGEGREGLKYIKNRDAF
ncbi:hypothetical protein HK101_009094 [Irineochytrium annulatum]|nr:hypothetical protein HK101_009094 [Irineochytrium annulatum]